MPLIQPSSIEAVRQQVNLLDVAQQYTQMKRAGSQWRGLSPFAHEKTPSFFVHPDKNVFTDYSSGKSGDLFRFVQLKENLGFTEAVETLARRFNIHLEYEQGSSENTSVRKELFEIHEFAADWFHEQFNASNAEAAHIREYWTSQRQFELETAREFSIGFAPPEGGDLFKSLRRKGFSNEAIIKCGLFFLKEDRPMPAEPWARFKGRLMIPIRDIQGRVTAFTARKTDLTPESDRSRESKYINSPETPIFHKSQMLFNFDRARTAIEAEGYFVMVEGQLDAIRCWTVGIRTAVAPQGTSVTAQHLNLIKRYANRVYILLDGDDAGQRAAFSLLPKAFAAGIDASFLPLSPGQDPDDLLREKGRKAFEELMASPLQGIDLAVQKLIPDPASISAADKVSAIEQILAILNEVESASLREEYIKQLSARVGIRFESLVADARRIHKRRSTPAEQPVIGELPSSTTTRIAPPAPDRRKLISLEEETLIVGFNYSYLFSQALAFLDPAWIETSSKAGALLAQMLFDYGEGVWDGAEDFIDRLEDPELKGYASHLAKMGIAVLNFRCDGDYLKRDESNPNPDPANITWEPDEALRQFVVALLGRFIEREIQRLNQEFLNAGDSDKVRRKAIIGEKRQLRLSLDSQRQAVTFAA